MNYSVVKTYIMTITVLLQIMSTTTEKFGSNAHSHLILLEQYQSNSVLNIINENAKENLFEGSYNTILKTNQEIQGNYPTFIFQNFFNVSELFLQNRWKAAKWRFGHTVAIFSESLKFVSKGLQIYGPNISENASAFVIMSQTSFDVQNGTTKFQRDVVYRKMYPKLVLILIQGESKGFKIQVICILCPNALSLPGIILLKNDFQEEFLLSAIQSMNALHQEFNIGKGHGSGGMLCQVGPRGTWGDANYHKHLEITARWRYEKTADKIGIILGILMNRFNFTLIQETWATLQGNYSGIYLNPGGDMPMDYIYGRQLILGYVISEFLMYCRQVAIISSTGWDFLWAPLDLFTWGMVFITGILFCLYHRGQVSYGLDVFWAILAIPPSSDWTKSKLLSCSLVVLLNLNVGYLSVITSKVIIPNREADIETPEELFKQGFHFIDGNVSLAGESFVKYWKMPLEAAKVDTSEMSNVLVQVDSTCFKTHEPRCIAKWAGLATGVIYAHYKTEKLLEIPVDVRDRCHGVKKPFRTYWVSFYSQGPLAGIIYDTYQALSSAGIDSFWDKLQKTSSVYDAYREANHTQAGGDPPKLNFKTPILVVFKAYGVLITICIISFPIEWFYHYLWNCKSRNTKTQIITRNNNNNNTTDKGSSDISWKNLMLRLVMFCCNVEERDNARRKGQPKIILVSNYNNTEHTIVNNIKGSRGVQVIVW